MVRYNYYGAVENEPINFKEALEKAKKNEKKQKKHTESLQQKNICLTEPNIESLQQKNICLTEPNTENLEQIKHTEPNISIFEKLPESIKKKCSFKRGL